MPTRIPTSMNWCLSLCCLRAPSGAPADTPPAEAPLHPVADGAGHAARLAPERSIRTRLFGPLPGTRAGSSMELHEQGSAAGAVGPAQEPASESRSRSAVETSPGGTRSETHGEPVELPTQPDVGRKPRPLPLVLHASRSPSSGASEEPSASSKKPNSALTRVTENAESLSSPRSGRVGTGSGTPSPVFARTNTSPVVIIQEPEGAHDSRGSPASPSGQTPAPVFTTPGASMGARRRLTSLHSYMHAARVYGGRTAAADQVFPGGLLGRSESREFILPEAWLSRGNSSSSSHVSIRSVRLPPTYFGGGSISGGSSGTGPLLPVAYAQSTGSRARSDIMPLEPVAYAAHEAPDSESGSQDANVETLPKFAFWKENTGAPLASEDASAAAVGGLPSKIFTQDWGFERDTPIPYTPITPRSPGTGFQHGPVPMSARLQPFRTQAGLPPASPAGMAPRLVPRYGHVIGSGAYAAVYHVASRDREVDAEFMQRQMALADERGPEFMQEMMTLLETEGAGAALARIGEEMPGDGRRMRDTAVKVFQPQYEKAALHEIRVQEEIRQKLRDPHPNIVHYLGEVEKSHERGVERHIVMEWIGGPTLHKLIQSTTMKAEEREILAKAVSRNLFGGLAAFERIGYVHNDIKPDNLMFDPDTRQFKIADLNNATPEGSNLGGAGHPLYVAPERIGTVGRKHPALEEGTEADADPGPSSVSERAQPASIKSDSYSAGQIIHQIMEGRIHLPGEEPASQQEHDLLVRAMWVLGNAKHMDVVYGDASQVDDQKTASGYYDFINRAMHPDREQRWTPEQLLSHRFLTENFPEERQLNTVIDKLLGQLQEASDAGTDSSADASTNKGKEVPRR